MRLFILVLLLPFCIWARSNSSSKQPLVINQNISMEMAQTAVLAAIESCAAKGYQVSATVVDSSGVLVASARADGAGPHTVSASRRKAYTAASARNATSAMLATSQSNPTAQHLGDIDEFLLLGGGLPIRSDSGAVIGGIGVGGAPGGPIDEQCAQAGLDKLATNP